MSQHQKKCHNDKKSRTGPKKIRNLKVKDLCVENLRAKNADIKIADIESLQVTTAGIKNLDVESITLNGRDLSCALGQAGSGQPAVRATNDALNPVLPPTKPDRVNQQVWEALLQAANLELNGENGGAFASASISGNTLTILQLFGGEVEVGQTVLGYNVEDGTIITGGSGTVWTVNNAQEVPVTNITFNSPILTECLAGVEPDGLRARIQCGREFVNAFLIEQGCPKPCPPCPTGPTGTVCEVPMEIYATTTFPIFSQTVCGPTGCVGATGAAGATGATGCSVRINFLVNVNYDLDVNYQLEVAGSTDSRVVSVVCLLGYIDPQDPSTVIIQLLKIGNRQFYPTLDVLYGENYNGVINVPSDIVMQAYAAMPNPNNTGAVQLIVYKEKGVCIWTDEACRGRPCTSNCPAGTLIASAEGCASGNVRIENPGSYDQRLICL